MINFDDKTESAFNEQFAEAFATKFGQQVMDHMKQAKTKICPICTDEVIAHDDDFCDECNENGQWMGNVFIDEFDNAWRF